MVKSNLRVQPRLSACLHSLTCELCVNCVRSIDFRVPHLFLLTKRCRKAAVLHVPYGILFHHLGSAFHFPACSVLSILIDDPERSGSIGRRSMKAVPY